MKNIIILPAIALGVIMTSCTDYFLDLKPLDTLTEANYYQTAQQFEAAANGTYSFYGYKKISEKVNGKDCAHDFGWVWDSTTDLLAGVSNTANGTLAASENDGYWGLCYAKIRKCNILLEKAEQYSGSESIEPYVATAKFFRAYQYYWMLMRFGGVPIVTRPLSSTSGELYMARNSRYEVVGQIIADLRDAIAGLPDEVAHDGHVTRQGAQAFLARVLLFEATWEKYVETRRTGTVSEWEREAQNLQDILLSMKCSLRPHHFQKRLSTPVSMNYGMQRAHLMNRLHTTFSLIWKMKTPILWVLIKAATGSLS